MGSSILDIATSALRVTQNALDTTAQNIANVNTEGYSRQRVQSSAREPQYTGAGFFGTGVQTTSVRRAYDQFLTGQLRDATSNASEIDRFERMTSQIDNLVADPDVGMASAMENFFNAVHDVASDPTSIPARQTMITEAQTLTDRFNNLDSRLKEMGNQIHQDMQNTVEEINSLASELANLNERITYEQGRSQGLPPNDLLDQRDQVVLQIAEKIDVTPVLQDNGAMSVFIGNGQQLVSDSRANVLGVKPSDIDPKTLEITLNDGTNTLTISNALSGGELGGLMRFQSEVLAPTENKLGRLAAGLATEFNQLHQAGYDLDGNTGASFFTLSSPEIPILQEGSGSIIANYDTAQIADLQASDYRLDYDGSTYTLTRLSDNTRTTIGSFPYSQDGIQIDVTTAPTGPASFLIRPTADAAGKLGVGLTDPRQIAAAENNTASGAVGDNGNALKLAALESERKMLGGNATFQDTYGELVAEVGSQTRSAQISRNAQEALKQRALLARESVSGVNLDEEAANLIKFQQAYQAAAKVVSVASQTFDTLINAVRR